MTRGTNRRPRGWGPWARENPKAMWYERTPKWKLAEIAKKLAFQLPRCSDATWFDKIRAAEQKTDDGR